jgi:serine/threonine protein kinase
LVKKNDSDEYYAMKILKKTEIKKREQVKNTITEKNVLQDINHPFTFYSNLLGLI